MAVSTAVHVEELLPALQLFTYRDERRRGTWYEVAYEEDGERHAIRQLVDDATQAECEATAASEPSGLEAVTTPREYTIDALVVALLANRFREQRQAPGGS